MLETQPGNLPTNKALTTALANVGSLPFIVPAVQEVWPQIAPAALAGPNMTIAVAALISGVVALGVAWFVPDRLGRLR